MTASGSANYEAFYTETTVAEVTDIPGVDHCIYCYDIVLYSEVAQKGRWRPNSNHTSSQHDIALRTFFYQKQVFTPDTGAHNGLAFCR